MISDKMTAAINSQINAETYSAYLYLAMSSYASSINLNGVANWMFVQAKEEMTHAQRLYNYVISQGARCILDAIEKPPAEFGSATDIFAATLEHEKKVTALINGLVDLAVTEKDHATEIMLQWFVTEQIEEEENASTILGQLKLAGDGGGLFMIDRELGARVFTMPPDLVQSGA